MKKTLKMLSRLLSVVLTVLLLLEVMPLSTLAADVTDSANLEKNIEDTAKENDEASEIVGEAESKRNEFTKVFKRKDGSYVAVIASSPIHYKKNDKWEDIDNTLVEKNINGESVLENKSNDFTVSLPEEMSEGKTVSMKNDGYTLSFQLKSEEMKSKKQKSKAKVKNNKSKKTADISDAAYGTDFESKSASVSYEKIEDNTNLEYVVTSTGLKENIILEKKPKAEVSYTYSVTAPNLTGVKNDDGSIEFKDSVGKVIFVIPSPVMYDTKMVMSTNIEVEFSKSGDTYTLTYTPSYEWLKKTAKYPVTVDPVIETPKEATGLCDTFVNSAYPNENYGALEYFGVAKTTEETAMTLLKPYDNLLMSSGSVVKSARLYVQSYVNKLESTASVDVCAYSVTGNWSENTVTYNTKPSIASDYLDKVKIYGNIGNGTLCFDVTKEFLDRSTISEGIMLKQNTNLPKDSAFSFHSSETLTAGSQPYFEIEYYETAGINSMFDYHTKALGRAGTLYVNDFSNSVYIERDELGLAGNIMPVQIKRHYNNTQGSIIGNNEWYGTLYNPYGFGWSINYYQFIKYYSDFSNGNSKIVYYNENGQSIYFEKTDTITDGKRKWTESSYRHVADTGCSLYIPTSYEENVSLHLDSISIVDAGGQKYEFNSNGFLVKIVSADNAANYISIVYNTSTPYYIDKIVDGVGRQYKFRYTALEDGYKILSSIQAYTASNVAIKVKNDAGNDVNYKYTYTYKDATYYGESFSSLSAVTYPDGKVVSYDLSGSRSFIKNIDGLAIYCGHPSSGYLYLMERAYTGDTYVTKGFMVFNNISSSYEKEFKDGKSNTTVIKQFDRFGRTTCVIDADGTVHPYTYTSQEDENGEIRSTLYNEALPENSARTNLLTNGSFTTNVSGWQRSNSTYVLRTDSDDCIPSASTKGCLYIVGTRSGMRYASQTVSVADGKAGDQYVVEGWSKSELAHSEAETGKLYGIAVEARKNTTGSEEWTTIGFSEYNSLNPNWHMNSYLFTLGSDYNQIRITVLFESQYGYGYFDNLALYNTYKATATGGTGSGSGSEASACPGYGSAGCTCTADECSENCPLTCCHRDFNTVADSSGFSFTMTDGENEIGMSRTNSGNYPHSQTDINGITTLFSYNAANGQMASTTDGNGKVSTYTYNAVNALTSVSAAVSGLSDGSSMSTSYTYTDDRISSITHNGFSYNYTYDVWGKLTSVKVGNQPIISYGYDNDKPDTPLNTITYGNNAYVTYTNNSDGAITAVNKYNSSGTLTGGYVYTYGSDGNITKIKDTVQDVCTVYGENGVTVKKEMNTAATADDIVLYSLQYSDGTATESFGTANSTLNYSLSSATATFEPLSGVTTSTASISSAFGTIGMSSATDYFGRQKSKEASTLLGTEDGISYSLKLNSEYKYKTLANGRTSTLISSYKNSIGMGYEISDPALVTEPLETNYEAIDSTEYFYSYDAGGNITRIYIKDEDEEGNVATQTVCCYQYDDAGQLVRENNALLDKTYKYTYDKGSNITQKQEYAFTEGVLGTALGSVDCGYTDTAWNDKLTSYNGTAIQYDSIGNPLNYVGRNLSGDTITGTLEWNGRELAAVNNSEGRYEYQYNEEGLRTTVKQYETNGNLGAVYSYIWQNGILMGYSISDGTTAGTVSVKILHDNTNEAIGFIYCDAQKQEQTPFYFGKNVQGDITAVYDSGGALLISYTYDAWGNVTATSSGSGLQQALQAMVALMLTPITYRGYQYDQLTGLYYLQSRFYNPQYGRFLNADTTDMLEPTVGDIHGANLFAYCNNEPIRRTDPTGMLSLYQENDDGTYSGLVGWGIGLGASAGAIVLGVYGGFEFIHYFVNNNFNNSSYFWGYSYKGNGYDFTIDTALLAELLMTGNFALLIPMLLKAWVSFSFTIFLIFAHNIRNEHDYEGSFSNFQLSCGTAAYSVSTDYKIFLTIGISITILSLNLSGLQLFDGGFGLITTKLQYELIENL